MENDLIEELAIKAGYVRVDGADFFNSLAEQYHKKFAELIVTECLEEIEGQIQGGRELEDGTHSLDWDAALECVDAMIRHRFGLKREILDTVISDDNKPQGSVTYTIEKGA